MAQHNELGKLGEQLAADFLEKKGYVILEKSWRWSRAEIDLIAEQNSVMVFVEVKTRSSVFFGAPEEFFTPKKEKFMSHAAELYCEKAQHDGEIRFDLIAVVILPHQTPSIQHFEDVFFPGWGNEI